MKFTIEGFNQEVAINLQREIDGKVKKIDCTDLVILRWFVDFNPEMRKMIIDGKEYSWVFYNKIIEDLPLIDISKRALSERLQKLVDLGILDFYLCKEGGTFTLYRLGNNYSKLIKGCSSNNKGGAVETATGVDVQTTTKDKSIIEDKSIKNSIKEKYKKENPEVLDIIGFWNERSVSDKCVVTEKNIGFVKRALQQYSAEDIKTAIDRYKQVINDTNYYYNYSWKLGEFLTRKNGIPDFLDGGSKWQNYVADKNKKKTSVNRTSASSDDEETTNRYLEQLKQAGII